MDFWACPCDFVSFRVILSRVTSCARVVIAWNSNSTRSPKGCHHSTHQCVSGGFWHVSKHVTTSQKCLKTRQNVSRRVILCHGMLFTNWRDVNCQHWVARFLIQLCKGGAIMDVYNCLWIVRGGTAAPLRKRSLQKRSGTFGKFLVQEENGKNITHIRCLLFLPLFVSEARSDFVWLNYWLFWRFSCWVAQFLLDCPSHSPSFYAVLADF